jgi:hypothetical protein
LTNIQLSHVDDINRLPMIPTGSNYIEPIRASDRLCIAAGNDSGLISCGSGEMPNAVMADITAYNRVI